MSADILNIVVDANQSKTSTADKTSSKSVSNNETPTKSLFDSLLNSASTQATTNQQSVEGQGKQTTDKKVVTTDANVAKNTNVKSTTAQVNTTTQEQKTTAKNEKPTSLLDKLILDAKSELKAVKEIVNEVSEVVVKPKDKTDKNNVVKKNVSKQDDNSSDKNLDKQVVSIKEKATTQNIDNKQSKVVEQNPETKEKVENLKKEQTAEPKEKVEILKKEQTAEPKEKAEVVQKEQTTQIKQIQPDIPKTDKTVKSESVEVDKSVTKVNKTHHEVKKDEKNIEQTSIKVQEKAEQTKVGQTNTSTINKIVNQDEIKNVVINAEVVAEKEVKKVETAKNKEVKETIVHIKKDDTVVKVETKIIEVPLENTLANGTETVVDKNSSVKTNSSEKHVSLIDQVINATKQQQNTDTAKQNEVVKNSANTIVSRDDLNASIILSSQKSATEINKLKSLNKATAALDDKTVASVKKSADMLGLNVEDIKVDKKEQISTTNTVNHTLQGNKIQNVLNSTKSTSTVTVQNVVSEDIQNSLDTNNKELVDGVESTKSAHEKHIQRAKLEDKVIELVVPNNAVKALQAKIIGARQQASSFMSEVARNMYLNYKAPLTAFRMNLNPANLGQIAIVMRSNKSDNSINISMNMSNNNTLDAFVDNKTALQNALNKTFNESSSSNVSLNFGMQSDASNQSFEQSKQEEYNNNHQQSFVANNTSVEEVIEDSSDYM